MLRTFRSAVLNFRRLRLMRLGVSVRRAMHSPILATIATVTMMDYCRQRSASKRSGSAALIDLCLRVAPPARARLPRRSRCGSSTCREPLLGRVRNHW